MLAPIFFGLHMLTTNNCTRRTQINNTKENFSTRWDISLYAHNGKLSNLVSALLNSAG